MSSTSRAWPGSTSSAPTTSRTPGRLPAKPEPAAEDARAAHIRRWHSARTRLRLPQTIGGPFVDPYEGCEPAVADSKFWAETWLRIGEYHFDFDFSPHGLNTRSAPTARCSRSPRTATTTSRSTRSRGRTTARAATRKRSSTSGELVEWSDDERKRTGKRLRAARRSGAVPRDRVRVRRLEREPGAGPDRRPAARHRPRPGRAAAAAGQPWTSEVFFQLGYVYFDEAKYPEAIEIWKLALKRWPLDPQAPEVQNIDRRRAQRASTSRPRRSPHARSSATTAKARTGGRPTRTTRSSSAAPSSWREDALINTAIAHHQRAQSMRRRCVEEQEPDLCTQAQEQYGLAAMAYRSLHQALPEQPAGVRAASTTWRTRCSGRRTTKKPPRSTPRCATRTSTTSTCRSRHVCVGRVAQAHGRDGRQAASCSCAPSRPRRQARRRRSRRWRCRSCCSASRARARCTWRASTRRTTPRRCADSYFYNNTLLLYLYGYWDLARSRFYVEFTEHCSGPKAAETGQVAWLNMRNMAVALGKNRRGPLARRGAAEPQVHVLAFGRHRGIGGLHQAREQGRAAVRRRPGPDQPALPRGGGDLRTRREEPPVTSSASCTSKRRASWSRPSTTSRTIRKLRWRSRRPHIALERTSRFESAGRLYQRIIDEVGPRKAAKPEEQAALDAILANAYFRLALQRQSLLRLRSRGRELPHAGRLPALRVVARTRR